MQAPGGWAGAAWATTDQQPAAPNDRQPHPHVLFSLSLCRHLADGLGSLGNPIGSPGDKIKVGLFRLKSLLGSLDDLLAAPETTIYRRLKVCSF